MDKKYRIIAHYLPQYYPIPENNKWWGNGFTEWVNVASARSLFKGHVQPHIPADLGFYDLRYPEIRQMQAKLATEAGIEGFCYWHYWFGKDKRLLEYPFNEVLRLGKPHFPFCLAWANHSWYAKTWDSKKPNKLLIKQEYNGVDDYVKHFYEMLPAFQDPRYITVKEKKFFVIFDPLGSPEIQTFIDTWRNLAVKNGLNDFYFVGHGLRSKRHSIMKLDFDAFQDNSLFEITQRGDMYKYFLSRIKIKLFKRPSKIYDYSHTMKKLLDPAFKEESVIPTIYPNWDHSPRSKQQGLILTNPSPSAFKAHVKDILNLIKQKDTEERIAMIKSWNEWGEGNYLEPDRQYGTAYLDVLKSLICNS